MSKVTLTKVWKGTKETKFGLKPTVAIKCNEHGDKWISTFKVTPAMDSWKEGDTVEVNITENKGFFNFDTQPNPVGELEDRIAKLERAVFGSKDEPVIQMGGMEEEKEVDPFDF